MLNRYKVNYQYGVAFLWTPVEGDEEAMKRFYQLAGQCFGIRKSIGETKLVETKKDVERPMWAHPWASDFYEALQHTGGDTIIWDNKGEKVKSEWDSLD
jgi:hypothetical protein